MCTYPQSDHALPSWKCVLRCFSKCPCINLPGQETDHQYLLKTPSIWFHIYQIIGRCTTHGRITLKEKKHVTGVSKNLHRITLQKYTPEKS